MSASRNNWARWLKFNAVRALGICIQLAVLAFLRSGLGMNYLLATALAVEATVLHNFFFGTKNSPGPTGRLALVSSDW